MRLGCEETKKNSQPRLVFSFFSFFVVREKEYSDLRRVSLFWAQDTIQ